MNYVTTEEQRKPEDYYSELDFKTAEEYLADAKKRAVKDYLADALIANSKVKEYPEQDIDTIYNATVNTFEMNLQSSYGMSLEGYLSQMGQSEEDFKNSLVSEHIKPLMENQIVMYAVLDKEGIEVTKAEIKAEIQEIIDSQKNLQLTEDYIKQMYGEYYFESMLVNEKALDFMYDNAKIS